MSEKMNRRSFIKTTAAMGAASFMGKDILAGGLGSKSTTEGLKDLGISVVKGENGFKNALQAVEQLGGIEQFVRRGSRVAILANPQRNNPGAFTKPEIVRAAVQMCKKAGAKEIACISQLPDQNWEATGLKKVLAEEGANLVIVDRKDESQFKTVPIPQGIALKEAAIMNELYKYDVFIDMPITKDHAGNKFTGTMKNLMGLSSSKTNASFHMQNWTTDTKAIAHLDQCIADLNTIVTPTLCIVDATEFVTTNGPFGPGEIIKPQKVIAGVDRVAVDAYCCTLWGLQAKDILQINKAYDHNLGEMDLAKVRVKESTA
jgi:uncharacterized protein (DUF362 family)